MGTRILIVGGGIMGLSTALACARRSVRNPVVLLERRHFGAGSSGRSGAILRQHYRDAEVACMARDSLREYADFERRTGREIGFQRTGVLTLAGSGAWAERVRENVRMLRGLGIETELLDATALRALVPGITASDATVAAWEPSAGFVDPQRTLEAFAELARERGVEFHVPTEVRALSIESGRVRGVLTERGEVRAEVVAVMAGPWTRNFLAQHGLELPLKVVRPENHYLGVPEMVRAPADFDATHPMSGLHPVLIDLEHAFYARCDPAHARTRIGKVDYDGDQVLADPDAIDETVSEEFIRWGRATCARRIASYAERPDAGTIAAWYTLTPDAQALIGPVRELPGLFVASGFSGHGFKLAPSVGEGVAQMLFDEPVTAFDPRFFALERFQGNEPWGGRFGL
jgi:glycine/D-amino acid oxidase-like deaminating enzyme